jgi:hypothetical protein
VVKQSSPYSQFLTISLPEGYELAEKKPREPKVGEDYLVINKDGSTFKTTCSSDFNPAPRYILRPIWKPPASCPKGMVFVKREHQNNWLFSFKKNDVVEYVATMFYSDFTPPPYSPYIVK